VLKATRDKKAARLARLFAIPAWTLRRRRGTSTFDMAATVDAWVQTKAAPSEISASKIADGKVVRTRPLCAYPAVATYRGTGSTDEAANFVCR
jgi:feruloyl esterase